MASASQTMCRQRDMGMRRVAAKTASLQTDTRPTPDRHVVCHCCGFGLADTTEGKAGVRAGRGWGAFTRVNLCAGAADFLGCNRTRLRLPSMRMRHAAAHSRAGRVVPSGAVCPCVCRARLPTALRRRRYSHTENLHSLVGPAHPPVLGRFCLFTHVPKILFAQVCCLARGRVVSPPPLPPPPSTALLWPLPLIL